MKKLSSFLAFIAFLFIIQPLNGQVVISDDGGVVADPSSVLDLQSTTKGFLLPQMTEAQRDAISIPAAGLIIYQTDGTDGVYQYDGSAWTAIGGISSGTHYVGEFYGGGIVFWVDETGHHGLVCAKEDQSTGVRWYAGTTGYTQAKGDGPFAGEANTSIIIAAQVAIGDDGSTYAARICNELKITEGGKTYGDWYLPSKEELNLMFQNKTTIDATATTNGGSAFANAVYWSSTEHSTSSVWVQWFYDGYQYDVSKDGWDRVRTVRAF